MSIKSIVEYAYENHKVLKSFKAMIIQPSPGVMGDSLVANKNLISKRLAHGKQKAQEALKAYSTAGKDFRFHIT